MAGAQVLIFVSFASSISCCCIECSQSAWEKLYRLIGASRSVLVSGAFRLQLRINLMTLRVQEDELEVKRTYKLSNRLWWLWQYPRTNGIRINCQKKSNYHLLRRWWIGKKSKKRPAYQEYYNLPWKVIQEVKEEFLLLMWINASSSFLIGNSNSVAHPTITWGSIHLRKT